jgi:hypothetical protein
MRVRLFDEFERTDPSPRGYEEDTFSFLNRVDQPFWQEIRDELERWYADYPDEEHGFGLRARFRKADPASISVRGGSSIFIVCFAAWASMLRSSRT